MQTFECYIKPLPGELVEVTIPLPTDAGALITGVVQNSQGHAVAGALVLLLEKESEKLLISTLTDGMGRFYLGPVTADTLYILRVQAAGTRTRVLELKV